MGKNESVNPLQHTDVEFVEGLINKNPRIEKDFYEHCRLYFDEHYRAVFFSSDDDKDDIFQNAFITLWQNIERGKIRVEDGIILGRHDEPLRCSLNTYLMSIARNKYLELVRSSTGDGRFVKAQPAETLSDDERLIDDWLEDDYENAMFEVINDSISVMPPSCSKLLTKFYYENKKLDDMLCELPSYSSKDALKSNKNRCLERLKAYARNLYKIRKSR